MWRLTKCLAGDFNPLPPCGGRLQFLVRLWMPFHFNPLPPCGGRRGLDYHAAHRIRFQSTPSVWRETLPFKKLLASAFSFQSTPSVWRETRCGKGNAAGHAISIHSLRVEGDCIHWRGKYTVNLFQSTPSVWRETANIPIEVTLKQFQSTPSVWRETASDGTKR